MEYGRLTLSFPWISEKTQLRGQKLSNIMSLWEKPWCTKAFGAQKHLWPLHHNDNSRWDNKCKRVKGATAGQKLMRMLATNAMQTHKRSPSFRPYTTAISRSANSVVDTSVAEAGSWWGEGIPRNQLFTAKVDRRYAIKMKPSNKYVRSWDWELAQRVDMRVWLFVSLLLPFLYIYIYMWCISIMRI